MPRKLFAILSSVLLAFCLLFITNPTHSIADELDDINKQLAQLNDDLNKSVAATKPVEAELKSMQNQITSIKNQVVAVEQGIVTKKREIDNGYERLKDKEKIIAETISSYYINSYYDCPICEIFSLDNASDITLSLAYQRAKTNQDKQVIINLALSITDLERKKAELLEQQKLLAVAKTNLDSQSKKLDDVVKGAKNFQSELSGKIAALSAKQQEIVNAKSGGGTFTVGSGELADEYLSSIKGFRESAPGGNFAIFSFGANSHRNGMSQYGARGRAEAGQNYQSILQKYYPGTNLETKGDLIGEINVKGHGNMSFEDRYLLGIAEMPSSWHVEALKAQAIAARTYALRNKDMAGGICTDEGCQVFLASKADNPPQAWRDAVQSTRGQVLLKDGSPSSTQYSSTSGGYLKTSGWDTTDGSGGNFIDKAYEKLGGSPWLYKAWWRQGYSNSGATCGRSNPWLSPQEMADILNATLYRDDRVTPISSCWGGNPYSMDELRAKANGASSVSSVSVLQGNGTTNEVVFQTNIGEKRVNATAFKDAVNVRAPGYIAIPQSPNVYGQPFFNIEQK